VKFGLHDGPPAKKFRFHKNEAEFKKEVLSQRTALIKLNELMRITDSKHFGA